MTGYLIYILLLHWVADFLLQTDKMALGKSSSLKWLGYHTGVYTLTLAVGTLHPLFALINGLTHFCIDFVTSKINKDLWERNRRHTFFVMIGFDQFLHTAILLLTLKMMF